MKAQNNFQLNSQQIFTPGEEVFVQFYQYHNYRNRNKKQEVLPLYCTLYKVNDALAFFEKNNIVNNQVIFDEEELKQLDQIRSWEEAVSNQQSYRRSQLKLGTLNEGVYVLEAVNSAGQIAQVPVFVSSYGIVTRTVGNELLAYVHDLKSGKAQNNFPPHALVNKKVIEPAKYENGLAYFDLEGLESNNQFPLLAHKDGKFAVSQAYINAYYAQQNNGIKSYVFTDRSAYRLEQTVKIKGLFRKKDGFDYKVVSEEILVTINDSKNSEILKQGFKLDEHGSFDAELALGADAALGDYWITVTPKDQSNPNNHWWYYNNQNRFSFKVEEYKKPEYEVLVSLDKSQYVTGDKIEAEISAQYFFGAPVQNAEIEYRIVREQYYIPWYRYMRCYWWYSDYYNRGHNQEVVKVEKGKIGEDGKLKIKFQTEEHKDGYNYRYHVYADVRDASRRTITGSSSAIVANTEFTLTAHSEKYYYDTDEKIRIRVAAADYSQNPVETSITANLVDYSSRVNNNGKVLKNQTVKTNAKTGEVFVEFDAPRSGYYRIDVEATDSRGRTTKTQAYAYVLKENDYRYNWWQSNGQITILTDKKVYDAGEKVEAMVYIPHQTDALVTLNGKALSNYGLYDFAGKKSNDDPGAFRKMSFEITPEAYGRMEVSVVYFKDKRLYQRVENITVIPQSKYLEVSIEFDESQYKPRETATAMVKVTDEEGRPVPNAQVTLSTADESIFFLYPDKTKDIRQSFYENENYHTQNQQSYFNSYAPSRNISPEAILGRIDKVKNGFIRDAYLMPEEWIRTTYEINEATDLMLSGFVVDYKSGAPIANAIITVGGKTFNTNEAGYYSIKGFKAGKKTLKFSKDNQITWLKEVQLNEGQNTFLNVALGEKEKTIDWATLAQNVVISDDMMMMDGAEEAQLESVEVTAYSAKSASADMAVGGRKMKRSMSKERGVGGAAASNEYKQEVFQEATIRNDFQDAIYWNPTVVTDGSGMAKVEIYLPDNLTTWRTMAKVITKDTKVGQTVTKTIVKKDLLVRMEIPRFITLGDELLIATNIHNYLSEEKTVKVQLFADGLKLDNTEQRIQVPANGEKRIDWKVDALWITEAELTVKALTDEESDAMELKVPVKPFGLEVVKAFSANLKNKSNETLEITIPKDIELNTASIELNASPSVTSALLASMDQLIGYPYGCVEQTMSRFLPNVIVGNTLKNLGEEYQSSIDIEQLNKMTEAGFKRLGQLQHQDGGWGWWAQDASHPFMTAYVCYGMFMAQQAGLPVDQNIYTRATNALKQQINSGKTDDPSTCAYQMMVAQQMGLRDLWNPSEAFSQDENAYTIALWLQAAVLAEDQGMIDRSLKVLEKAAIKEGRSTYWGGKKFYYSWRDDRVETTANAIKAISMVDPNHELLGDAVQWLLKQRKGNAWHNTRQTAMTIYGLQEIIKQEVNPNMTLEIWVNGQKVEERTVGQEEVFQKGTTMTLTGEELYASTKNSIDLKDYAVLKNGVNKIEFRQTGNGTHYIGAQLKFFADKEKAEKYNDGKTIFDVDRTYYKLIEKKGKEGKISYDKKAIKLDQIQSGDNILVKVKIKSDNRQEYVLIEDPIPAGCEFIRDTKAYPIPNENIFDANQRYGYGYGRWNYWYSHREFRDSHLAITITNLNQGTYEYSYLMKAQIPGNYQVAPTVAQLMYYPENRGYSDFGRVEIRD